MRGVRNVPHYKEKVWKMSGMAEMDELVCPNSPAWERRARATLSLIDDTLPGDDTGSAEYERIKGLATPEMTWKQVYLTFFEELRKLTNPYAYTVAHTGAV